MEEDRIKDVIISQLMPSSQGKYKQVTVEFDMKNTVVVICRNETERSNPSTEELKPGRPRSATIFKS